MLAPSQFLISDLSFRLAQKDTSATVSTQLWIAIGYSLITEISRQYLKVRHPPQSGWLGEWGRLQCEAVSNVELARQGTANRGFPEFHLHIFGAQRDSSKSRIVWSLLHGVCD